MGVIRTRYGDSDRGLPRQGSQLKRAVGQQAASANTSLHRYEWELWWPQSRQSLTGREHGFRNDGTISRPVGIRGSKPSPLSRLGRHCEIREVLISSQGRVSEDRRNHWASMVCLHAPSQQCGLGGPSVEIASRFSWCLRSGSWPGQRPAPVVL